MVTRSEEASSSKNKGKVWYGLLLVKSSDLCRKIDGCAIITLVPILIIHRAKGVAAWMIATDCRSLTSSATSEGHPGRCQGARNEGRARQCVLRSHAANDQQRCNNLETVDIELRHVTRD